MAALLFAALLLAAPDPLLYWVEPCDNPATRCHADDGELAAWALRAWQNAAPPNSLKFAQAAMKSRARIRVLWASPEQGLYGEARTIWVGLSRGAEVHILPAPLSTGSDPLLRDAVVYLTCLHETGHALGLPHTAAFDDIMYSFQYGGDIAEYFARYRRKLRTRADIQANAGISDADRRHLAEALGKR